MESVLQDCLAQFSSKYVLKEEAAPGCFEFIGVKGCCGGFSHEFWEKFLNLPVVKRMWY